MNAWVTLITFYVLVQNFGLAACVSWLGRERGLRWTTVASFSWATLMFGLFILQAVQPSHLQSFFDAAYFLFAIEMAWNVLLIQVVFPLILLVVIVARWRKSRRRNLPEPEGISRRRFLYLVGCGAVPATAIAMGVHGGMTRFDLRRRDFTIPIAGLPAEMEGFTIAHVSDLHSGLFVGERRLKIITDATNDLKADMIALTGDLINREMTEFPAALAAIQRMKAPLGVFVCEGNHDVIPGPGLVVNACAENHLSVLYNNCLGLRVRGHRLLLGGISWELTHLMAAHPDMVTKLFPARQPGDIRILFAHHPHLFDIAQSADLVLSGHTHGGQIMFGENEGLGRIRFKYCSGLFQRDTTSLVVSNGAGDWFPCRIGAPAEVGLIRLTRANT